LLSLVELRGSLGGGRAVAGALPAALSNSSVQGPELDHPLPATTYLLDFGGIIGPLATVFRCDYENPPTGSDLNELSKAEDAAQRKCDVAATFYMLSTTGLLRVSHMRHTPAHHGIVDGANFFGTRAACVSTTPRCGQSTAPDTGHSTSPRFTGC